MNKLPIILASALAAFCLLAGCRAEKRAESAVSTVSETGNTEPSLAENAVTAPAEPFFFEGTYRPDSRAEEVETGRVSKRLGQHGHLLQGRHLYGRPARLGRRLPRAGE